MFFGGPTVTDPDPDPVGGLPPVLPPPEPPSPPPPPPPPVDPAETELKPKTVTLPW